MRLPQRSRSPPPRSPPEEDRATFRVSSPEWASDAPEPPSSSASGFHCELHSDEAGLLCSRFSQYVPSVMTTMDHDGFANFLLDAMVLLSS